MILPDIFERVRNYKYSQIFKIWGIFIAKSYSVRLKSLLAFGTITKARRISKEPRTGED